MPKWKKDETEFLVSVSNDGNGSNVCRIPKPIMEKLEQPKKIKFMIKNRRIIIDVP